MKYLIFALKSKIKILPILCAILLIFMGSFFMISQHRNNKKIQLEICFAEKDPKNNLLLGILNGTRSTKQNMDFSVVYDTQEAKRKLQEGKTDVLIEVPKGFYKSILNSENKKAIIYYSPRIGQMERGVFTSIANSSASILSSAQANIYISDSKADGAEKKRNKKLNKYFLNESLNREDLFTDVPKREGMYSIFVYIGMLIVGIVLSNTKHRNHLQMYAHFKVKGYGIYRLLAGDVFVNTLVCFCLSILVLYILKIRISMEIGGQVLLLAFLVSACIEGSIYFFKEASGLFFLGVSLLSILSSGILLPRAGIFSFISFSPISLLLKNTFLSWGILFIYAMGIFCLTNYKIHRLLQEG